MDGYAFSHMFLRMEQNVRKQREWQILTTVNLYYLYSIATLFNIHCASQSTVLHFFKMLNPLISAFQ